MRFVVYGQNKHLGVLQEERILDLASAALAAGREPEQFHSLINLIESGERGLDTVRELMERNEESEAPGLHVDITSVELHAPFPGRRFALAGSNNPDHVANALVNRGRDVTSEQVRTSTREGPGGGFWVVAPPVGPGAAIEVPRSSRGLLDFEGEVAVVLSRGGKRIPAAGWSDRIWGTVLVIDWSIRSQSIDSSKRPFYAHKIFDNSKSLGPWISVGEVDPLNCEVETRVNGELRQKFRSGDMIHTYAELLEQISEDFTLMPGDVLSGGTGAGTAVDATLPGDSGELPLTLFLKTGDRVEVSAPNLGTLTGTIVAGT